MTKLEETKKVVEEENKEENKVVEEPPPLVFDMRGDDGGQSQAERFDLFCGE